MRRLNKRTVWVVSALVSGLLIGLTDLACAQGPMPTPGVMPTLTPVPPAWYEGDKAPWIIALVLGALGFLLGKLFGPALDRFGAAINRWLQELGFNFEKNYLNALAEKHRYLKFVGVRDRPKGQRPKLEEVYVSLQMGSATQADASQAGELSLGQALRAHRNLVILGEPGAGKSTLLRYLILVFAGIAKNDLGLDEKRLPIYVRLKDCVGNANPICEILSAPPTLPVSKAPPDFFEKRLRRGQCIVLLDGLDEVVDDAQKKVVTEKIAQFVGEYTGNRFVVTCRTAGWDSDLLPGSFVALKIRDLNPAQVTRFVHDWYKAVITNEKLSVAGDDADNQAQARQAAADDARTRAEDLVTRLEAHERLARLSKNPLILSLIALVHYNRTVLPQRRAEVYQDCLDVLLDQWDRDEHEIVLPDAPLLDVKRELAQAIAYHFQTTGVDEANERELLGVLAPILEARRCKTSPQKCLQEQMVERSGLLAERAIGRYSFAHRTLQEYLVAKRYVALPDQRAELLAHLNEEPWREVILLYIGLLENDALATRTVRDILAQPDDAAHTALILAGQCFAESNRIGDAVRQECSARLQNAFDTTTDALVFIQLASALGSIGGADVVQYFAGVLSKSNVNVRVVAAQALGALGKRIPPARILTVLQTALRDREPAVRRAAIASLGQLGYANAEIAKTLHTLRENDDDPTVRAAAVSVLARLGQAAELNLVKIPAGEFLMGSNEDSDEQPPHQVYLDEYYIARYPVTNAEFEPFVQAGSYRDARYWTQAIADGWWKNGKFKGRYDKEPRDRPYDFGARFNLPNHPVVGISWYEATAYAMWAGMRLPTEAEWEKAAGWDDTKKEKRRYPWGDTFEATCCNSAESRQGARGIAARIHSFLQRSEVEGATTPVGQYSPKGGSPYGVADMAGNVWEWCADWYAADYYKNSPAQNPTGQDSGETRVLRGGSWGDSRNNVRAACRSRSDPGNRDDYFGFRVVVRPL